MPQIILASSSSYRKQLLERLKLDFSCISPDIDESPKPDETIQSLVDRLARQKAEAVALQHPDSWIIGSDQTASFAGSLIGKPGTPQAAEKQLQAFSGKSLTFYTSLCLLNQKEGFLQTELSTTLVRFRNLSSAEIQHYVAIDNPIDCAGSFKAESLGISLFDAVESEDPTALIGLPLIALCRLMRHAGIYP